jgi:purine-nucleoside phosphorylase
MSPASLYEMAGEAAASIRERVFEVPEIAVVLGSGLGSMADELADRTPLPYATIPHFPEPTVEGHAGNLVVGRIGAGRIGVIMLQGRFHHYEGHALEAVTFPIRVLRRLDVRALILTAATGGIRPGLGPGSLVCLSDHLNLLGANPLRGPNDERFGPRFADMTEVYSKRLRAIAADVSAEQGVRLGEGVYACLPGPSYETPAEIRMLRTLGADVVGMSTVPEAIVARHCGLEVLAFALVTNAAAGVTDRAIDHREVVEQGLKAGPALGRIIAGVIERLARGPETRARD